MKASLTQKITIFLGPILALMIHMAPTAAGLSSEGQSALAVLSLCVIWWVFTPVPLPVTSLVGMGLLPILDAMGVSETFQLFGNQAVFFVIGVFIVASVMLQSGISARVSLLGLRYTARSENMLCSSILFLSFALCSVIVSHAVAALMLPIILGIIRSLNLPHRSRLARRLLLSMAWGTVCGSNLGLLSSARASLALEFFEGVRTTEHSNILEIGMVDYTLAAAPLAIISVISAAVLLRWQFPEEGVDLKPVVTKLDADIKEWGPMGRTEWLTIFALLLMVISMVMGGAQYMGVTALLFCGVFFAFGLLQWEDAERYVNWGVVLLYGGAIAVGAAVHQTGASTWLVEQILPSSHSSPWLMLLAMGTAAALLTEVISNSAVIAILLPVALAMSERLGLNPRSVAILAPVCAGFAFVLPTSTPAMAMVFGVGYLRTRDTIFGILITLSTLIFFLIIAALWWPVIGFAPILEAP